MRRPAYEYRAEVESNYKVRAKYNFATKIFIWTPSLKNIPWSFIQMLCCFLLFLELGNQHWWGIRGKKGTPVQGFCLNRQTFKIPVKKWERNPRITPAYPNSLYFRANNALIINGENEAIFIKQLKNQIKIVLKTAKRRKNTKQCLSIVEKFQATVDENSAEQ